jgi:PAS domain S-box-containing protein
MLKKFLKDPGFLMNVFETMKEGLMVMDKDGTIQFFNKAAEEITGYGREEVLGQPCMMLDSDTCVVLTPEGRQKKCDLFKQGTIGNKRCRIRAKDGQAVYLLKNAVVLKDENDETVGGVETITDITSLYMKEIELEELKQELRQGYWFMGLLGNSLPMQKLYEQIRNASGSEAPVLIQGESGTGKNLVANAIHRLSRRKSGNFIKMNCAALNEHLLESELFGHRKGSFTGAIRDRVGRFEAANGGCILLDEIGDMSPMMQAKLLRVLEEKVIERVGENEPVPVDVRVISATNRDLHEMVVEETFREDLFYRISSIVIKAPPLRERVEDIPILAGHYLKKISAVNNKDIRRISPHAMALLEEFSWPGNVRQLINTLEHAAITCVGEAVEVADLPDYLFHSQKGAGGSKGKEKERIIAALSASRGNKTLAAKQLGISRVTLWKKLKKLEIS